MKCYKDTYEYVTEVDPSTNQYGLIDFEEVEYVNARYVKSFDPLCQGNPCVEALPRPRTLSECTRDYFKPLLSYNPAEIACLSSEERIYRLNTLRDLRLPMSFDSMLEAETHNALVMSYKNRHQFYNPDQPVWKAVVNTNHAFPEEAQTDNCGKYVTEKTSSIYGWSLLGGSGTGKSSAIDILKFHYPQVIRHPGTKGNLTQIVYLHVTCPSNSNFSVLYETIGAEIDKALGYTTGVYQRLVSKSRNPINLIVQLIENFCIGMIIFDEIQEIDFAGTKSNSFASLVTIGELSGVAIAVAGLDSAYQKMFKQIYTARRVGKVISTNRYCFDKETTNALLSLIFNYQWFDKRTILTEELKEKFSLYTGGRIDQIITLFTYMNYEYLCSPENSRPAIDGNLVENCIGKYYGDMKKLIADSTKYRKKNGDFDGRIFEAFEQAKKKLDTLINDDEQAKLSKVLTSNENIQALTSYVTIQTNVLKNVKSMFTHFSEKQITETLKQVYDIAENRSLNDGQLSGLVIQKLLGTNEQQPTIVKKAKPGKKGRSDANLLKQNLMNVYNPI